MLSLVAWTTHTGSTIQSSVLITSSGAGQQCLVESEKPNDQRFGLASNTITSALTWSDRWARLNYPIRDHSLAHEWGFSEKLGGGKMGWVHPQFRWGEDLKEMECIRCSLAQWFILCSITFSDFALDLTLNAKVELVLLNASGQSVSTKYDEFKWLHHETKKPWSSDCEETEN